MEESWDAQQRDLGVTVPFAGRERRRPRFLRRRPRMVGIEQLMADLAAIEPHPPEPEAGIDPEERALLVQLYRELVGTVEGPVVPFPVELMADPDYVEERERPAAVLDFEAFRARRNRPDEPGSEAGPGPDGPVAGPPS